MATLAQNINNTIAYLNDIRDAIINTEVGMPINTPVSEYSNWISKLKFIPILEISKDSYHFTYNGGTITIDITCNSNWTVTTTGDTTLFTVTPNSGLNNGTLTITAPVATLTREASLTITITSHNISKTISITQEKATYGKLKVQFNINTSHWPVTGTINYRVNGAITLKDALDPAGFQYIRNIDFSNNPLYVTQFNDISAGTYTIETALSVEANNQFITTNIEVTPKQITITPNQLTTITITID